MTISERIDIVPYPLDRQIDHLKVFVDNFRLGATDCFCTVYEYDVNGILLNVHSVYIEPELYSEWGTNDTYLIDIVLDKLGYVQRDEHSPVEFPE
jgi:hypothetical protein